MPIYNGNTYLLTDPSTWEQAQVRAQNLGGNLVTINSQAEQDWLVTTFGGTDKFWIGLTDNVTEGQFQWASGETYTYTNWFPGTTGISPQPDNGGLPPGEDYVVMNFEAPGKWNDYPSNNQTTFRGIIEITSSTPTITPTITLAVSPGSVLEDGTTTLTYIFTRTGATTNSLTVSYGITGTATSSDYTGATPGTGKTITFAAGSSTATLTIDPTADTTVESDETVDLTLASGTGYTVGTTTAVTGTITNDDSTPTITLAVSPGSVLEDGTTTLNYTFTRTGATTNSLTVSYGITGTATSSDYTGATPGTGKTITFAAGSSTATLTIDPTADTTVESDETVDLTLASGTGYTVGTTTAVTGTITNDDSINSTTFNGTNGNDTLTGGAGNDILNGGAGNDTLNGGLGNDTLDGGTGTDSLIGGLGNDIYVVDSLTDIITESPNAGTDTIQSSVDYTIAALTNVENLTLTGTATSGTGNAGNNVIIGNSVNNNLLNGGDGNDTLDGGAGNKDTLIGGAGNDIYVVDTTTDTITEQANAGTDTIQSSVTYTIGIAALTNIENLTLTGTAAINGTGNAGNNIITGNSSNNTLNGGAGTDILIGGAGDDTYVVDTPTDTIRENAGEGTADTIQSSVTYTIAAANVENLTLTGTAAINGTGNAGNNTITGNSANNTLNGGAGTDILIGGAGDDIYVVDTTTDTITENANAGTDTIQSSVTYTIAALTNIEKLTLTGTAAINGTGNAGNNVITGNIANNILDGGAGTIDALIGGLGDDIYVVDTTTDTITELANAGTDTIQSSVDYTITAANVENLTLTGTTAINGTGNAGDNTITGNSANNTLDGGAGNDTLIGGAGDDTYVVDSAADTITENVGEGTDTVQSSVTYTIAAANVENLTLTGTTAINGTGNAGDNTITGNSVDNTLDGGAGNDTLIGGAGDDTYLVDNIDDIITENANEGTDTVKSSGSFSIADFANVEKLILTGTATDTNATGNASNNTITGNIYDNTLDGGAGDDILIGGFGDDTYVVDTTTDTITENVDEGTDTVESSVRFSIAALTNVENLTLTGTDKTDAIGNVGNNLITGNSANNTLDGGEGNDTLDGGDGDDTYIFTINGIGLGTDTITDGSGVDTISFARTAANINIRLNLGTTLGQTVDANTKTKVVLAAGDAIENAIGGDGNDRLIGNSLDNRLEGGDGNDILNGSTGNDFLFGGNGNDSLTGGDGDDYLDGGLDSNNLFGGAGNDKFVFSDNNLFKTINKGLDIIADFTTGIDQLVLSKTVFDLSSDVGIGLSDVSDFDYVDDDELAGDSNARIVYSLSSGSLFYNQDGATAGFGTGGEFAVLDPLTANDFVIIA